jgi:hypothetical protein
MMKKLNTTEIICIKNDLKLIREELILYGFNIKLKEIKKMYFLNNRNIVEVIYYYVNQQNLILDIH